MDLVPPQNIDAEEGLLGGMMLDPRCAEVASDLLQTEMFYHEQHQQVFTVISRLVQQRKPIEVISIGLELVALGWEEHSTTAKLLSLMQQCAVATTARMHYFAGLIIGCAQRRAAIRAAHDIMDMAMSNHDATALLDMGEQRLSAIRSGTLMEAVPTVGEYAYSEFQRLEQATLAGVESGYRTGWHSLNRKLLPIRGGQVVVVGSRPGMGKTAFALNWAMHLAAHKTETMVFSLEMEGEEMSTRALLAEMQTTRENFDNWDFVVSNREDILHDMSRAVQRIWDYHLYIDDTAGLTVEDIGRRIRAQNRWLRRQNRQPLEAVFVDYLQMANIEGKKRSSYEEVSAISKGLTALAKSENVGMVILSQLSREVEKTRPYRPDLRHLRETGQIEQDAHRVLFLYRPGYYGVEEVEAAGYKQGMENYTEVICKKQRNGPMTWRTILHYQGDRYVFSDLTSEQQRLYRNLTGKETTDDD